MRPTGSALKSRIDSNACIAYIPRMSTTLTIRNLDEEVKRKLRLQAARHQRSMEAEAREILARGVSKEAVEAPTTKEEMRRRLDEITGIWKDRGTTDELIRLTRGED